MALMTTKPPDAGSLFNFFQINERSLLNHGRTIKITGKKQNRNNKNIFLCRILYLTSTRGSGFCGSSPKHGSPSTSGSQNASVWLQQRNFSSGQCKMTSFYRFPYVSRKLYIVKLLSFLSFWIVYVFDLHQPWRWLYIKASRFTQFCKLPKKHTMFLLLNASCNRIQTTQHLWFPNSYLKLQVCPLKDTARNFSCNKPDTKKDFEGKVKEMKARMFYCYQ